MQEVEPIDWGLSSPDKGADGTLLRESKSEAALPKVKQKHHSGASENGGLFRLFQTIDAERKGFVTPSRLNQVLASEALAPFAFLTSTLQGREWETSRITFFDFANAVREGASSLDAASSAGSGSKARHSAKLAKVKRPAKVQLARTDGVARERRRQGQTNRAGATTAWKSRSGARVRERKHKRGVRRQREDARESNVSDAREYEGAKGDFERKLEVLRLKKINKQLKGEVGEVKSALRRAKRTAQARFGEKTKIKADEGTATGKKQSTRHNTKNEMKEEEAKLQRELRKQTKKRKMLEAALDREMASDRGLLARARDAKNRVRAKDRLIEELLDGIRTLNRFIEKGMRSLEGEAAHKNNHQKRRNNKKRGAERKKRGGTGTRFFDESKANLIQKLERQLAGLKATWAETKHEAINAGAGIPTQHEMRAEMRELRKQMNSDRILLERRRAEEGRNGGGAGGDSKALTVVRAKDGVDVGAAELERAKMAAWDQQQKLRISKRLAKQRAQKSAQEAEIIQAKLDKIKARERAARVEKDRIEERLRSVQLKLTREFWRRCQSSTAQITRVARLFLLRKRGDEALVGRALADEAMNAAVHRIIQKCKQ